jgi:hypothetical protein
VIQDDKTRELIRPREGQKPKASGWVLAAKVPPRRCGEGFSSPHPLPRGFSDSQAAIKLFCEIRVVTLLPNTDNATPLANE